jgi:hypothetical protein
VDDRLNSEGIRRDQLVWVLTQRHIVLKARKVNSCLLCRRVGVNEAALCEVCHALLNDDEFRVASKWISGEGP